MNGWGTVMLLDGSTMTLLALNGNTVVLLVDKWMNGDGWKHGGRAGGRVDGDGWGHGGMDGSTTGSVGWGHGSTSVTF